jgi:DNA-binding PadR family transcriptional regulator
MDLLKSSGDLLVLSVLADGPLYGYAITKRIDARSSGAIRMTAGQLYPLLHKLEAQGLVSSSWDASPSEGGPGRKRKWYRLSAKGRRRLAQQASAHRAYQRVVESFLPRPDPGEARESA